jgi:crotonobetainyl-CoA:carnitine CoA-transferase CaiB-like acyl-CoA transferase
MAKSESAEKINPQALAGIRVLDFTWVRAGPWCTRWLGALGAEIIKVEWPDKPNTRGIGLVGTTPQGMTVDLNNSGHFSDTNANKLSITVNTKTKMGIDLVKRLISISDIVIENFAYGVLESWGLGYEDMKKLRPDIIYMSMSGFGHTGRNRDYQTMGPIAQALSGLTYTSGLPDMPPAGWGWSYMDDTGGMYGLIYAMSALHHRNVTGQGQHIDKSQWITGVGLNGAAFLDMQVNNRTTERPGYPPGNRSQWPGSESIDNYRERIAAPHNAYRTHPLGYNDWCTIVCFTDEEWATLVKLMLSPDWAKDNKFSTLDGRIRNQEQLDEGIEAWTKTMSKYEIMRICQENGIRSMPVQSPLDRFDNDPQLKHREMYRDVVHPTMGAWPLQNAPFKMSVTPAYNSLSGPLIGGHNKKVFEGLLGITHKELVDGFEQGVFWPKDFSMDGYPYLQDMIEDESPAIWDGKPPEAMKAPAPTNKNSSPQDGPLQGLRILELADEKGQWCGKIMADLGADVIKIEPPGGQTTRTIGPFYNDNPDKEKSLYFWHYNTSKRGITLNLETEEGKSVFTDLTTKADVILESLGPGYMDSIGLTYEYLNKINPKLIMCSLSPFGQTGPWKDYKTSDLVHLAVGGQMACCGYGDEYPDAPPIAPGGGQAWHTGSHYACISILAALVYRTVTNIGQYIDVSVHESLALTTEAHINRYIYTGEVSRRQTGRHAASNPTDETQHICSDGKYVNVAAQIVSRLTSDNLGMLGEWMDSLGLDKDLLEEKIRNPDAITDNEIFLYIINNMTRDQIYHGGQQRGFNMGAVRSPDDVMIDPHLEDRGFWTNVEYPEVGITLKHPGPGAKLLGSPWKISRRAPLIGEHTMEILNEELGLNKDQINRFYDAGII